ncbi:hypothetical protein Tcan_16793 [Toxocara canis]|uniref:Uncharacterized protein n=1 Tax=Toxocara canis TaxID=6265 RepID=A0A0B2VW86_TOXCA|nr:hypothetical protein Tcan_16793 [Toxocara canis]
MCNPSSPSLTQAIRILTRGPGAAWSNDLKRSRFNARCIRLPLFILTPVAVHSIHLCSLCLPIIHTVFISTFPASQSFVTAATATRVNIITAAATVIWCYVTKRNTERHVRIKNAQRMLHKAIRSASTRGKHSHATCKMPCQCFRKNQLCSHHPLPAHKPGRSRSIIFKLRTSTLLRNG